MLEHPGIRRLYLRTIGQPYGSGIKLYSAHALGFEASLKTDLADQGPASEY